MATTESEDDLLKEAIDRFAVASTADDNQRKREKEDLSFQIPANQWTDAAKETRKSYTVAGVPLPARPMISVSRLDQPIQLVLNEEKQAHLGIHVEALDGDADEDTAEVLQGLYRHIEQDSKAQLARSWAYERAVKAGTGGWRVNKVYDPHGGDPYDQKITIERIWNWASVSFDPASVKPDKSDADYCFVADDMPWSKVMRQPWFKDSKVATIDIDGWRAAGDTAKGWIGGEALDASRTLRVCEYWKKVYKRRTKVLLEDDTDGYQDEVTSKDWVGAKPKTGKDARSRPADECTVHWYLLTAFEVLDHQIWDDENIPIIPVIGRELQPFDDEHWFTGIIGPAKDAQRAYNYEITAAVEKDGLATKAPWIGPEGFADGHEKIWQQANTRNFPYLEYKPTTVAGAPAPPPQRNLESPDLTSSLGLAAQFSEAIQATTFVYDPSLGKTSSHRSGKAIDLLQNQAQTGNSDYLDNFVNVSLLYEAKVVLGLMKKVYDRPGRVVRILNDHDESDHVMLNQPHVLHPETGEPMPPPALGGSIQVPNAPKVLHYDLSKGAYGVNITIGKDYTSKRQAGSDAFGQILQGDPALMPVLGWYWFLMQDFPYHKEAAEDLKKLRPAALQQEDGNPQQAQQQVAQLQAQLQQAHQMLQQAGIVIQTKQTEQQGKVAVEQVRSQTQLEKARMDNETKLAVAELTAKVERLDLFLRESSLVGERAHDAATAAADHGADMALQQAQAQQASQQAAQQAQAASQQSAQEHGQALDQQTQQAALQPPPQAAE